MGSIPSKHKTKNQTQLQILHPHLEESPLEHTNSSIQNTPSADGEKELQKHQKIMKDLKTAINLLKSESQKDDNGRFSQTYLEIVAQVYMAFGKTGTQQHQFKYRQIIAQELSSSGIIDLLCDISVEIYHTNYLASAGQDDTFEYICLKMILFILGSCSEAYVQDSYIICNHPTFLRKSAEHLREIFTEKMRIEYENVMFRLLNLIRSVSIMESNIPAIRKYNYVEILTLYLESDIQKVRFQAIAIMADIVNEEESEVLQKGRNSLGYIKEAIQPALQSTARRHPWLLVHVWEFIRIIKQIARNDTNKKAVVDHGFLPLLVDLTNSQIKKEQAEAVATLRTLSFDKENQKIMITDKSTGVVDRFVTLLKSSDRGIANVCKGALWTMREELQNNDEYKDLPIVKSFTEKIEGFDDGYGADKSAGHVMISYQWSNQKMLIRVKDQLLANGLKVWMDIDDMAGSTLEAMARAVEEADVVLVCLSKKYKDSDNCRAEAEYAFEKRKTIIPLRMEKGYKPDGWLGIIIGSKKFYDFGGKYTFESRIDDLIKELRGKLLNSATVQVPQKKQIEVHKQEKHHFDSCSVKNWTKDQIGEWLGRHELDKERFDTLEGVEIVFLQLLLEKAVDVYYKTLVEQLKITDLKTMAKFTSALEDTTL